MKELGPLHKKIGDQHVVIQTRHFAKYHDGFSFVVDSEIDAFRAAHSYQSLRVNVKPAPNVNGWLVQVYAKQLVA